MKQFIITQKNLSEALKRVGHAVPGKSILPILSHILVDVTKEQTQFTATDLNVTIIYSVIAENKKEFQVLLPYHDLKNIASVTDGELTVQIEEKEIKLLHGIDVFNLGKEMQVKEYPKTPAVPVRNVITVSSDKVFAETLAKATINVAGELASEKDNPAFKSVCLDIIEDKLVVVASDKYTIFVKELPLPEKNETLSLLVDPKVAKVLDGFVNMQISYTKENVCFSSGAVNIICRGKDLTYLDWRAVLPKEKENNLFIKKNDLFAAVDKCSIVENTDRSVNFDITESIIMLSATDSGTSKSVKTSIPCTSKYVGPVRMRMDFILRALKQLDGPGIPADCELRLAIKSNSQMVGLNIAEDPAMQIYIGTISNPSAS